VSEIIWNLHYTYGSLSIVPNLDDFRGDISGKVDMLLFSKFLFFINRHVLIF